MLSANKKVVAVAAAGAAAAVIGLGVFQVARADDAGSTTPTPSSTATTTPGGPSQGWGPGGRHGGRGLVGMKDDLSALATKLGVDQTKLADALQAVRDELRAGHAAQGTGTKPDRAALQDEVATRLAAKLGIDAAKVKAALAAVQAEREADRQKAFDDRLAQAVKDGTLTQAEADAVKKAAKAGVIDMHDGPH